MARVSLRWFTGAAPLWMQVIGAQLEPGGRVVVRADQADAVGAEARRGDHVAGEGRAGGRIVHHHGPAVERIGGVQQFAEVALPHAIPWGRVWMLVLSCRSLHPLLPNSQNTLLRSLRKGTPGNVDRAVHVEAELVVAERRDEVRGAGWCCAANCWRSARSCGSTRRQSPCKSRVPLLVTMRICPPEARPYSAL